MVYFGGHCKTCLKVQKVQPSYIVWLHALSSDQCFGVHTRPFSLSRDGRLDWVSLYLFSFLLIVLTTLFKTTEGVIVGFQIFAWAPK